MGTVLVGYGNRNFRHASIQEGGGGGFDCGLAVVGLLVSFAGLATLTTVSGGLALGAAAIGFSASSVSMGRAC